MHPAESGKLAARHILVEIAEACWREAAKSGPYPNRFVRRYFYFSTPTSSDMKASV